MGIKTTTEITATDESSRILSASQNLSRSGTWLFARIRSFRSCL